MSTRMATEIAEIPTIVERLLGEPAGGDEQALRRRPPRFAVIVARGTSDHAATYARYLIETSLRIPTGLAAASVTTVYRARLDWRDVLCLAISQSGAGPDVAAVVAAARAGGAATVAITNEPTSELGAAAEHVLALGAGPERAVAATKTYVASLAVIARLVAALDPDAPWVDALPAVPDRLARTLEATDGWLGDAGADLVAELAAAEEALIVSRGHNLATALELALKLKETSRIFAEGYSSADLLHGPVVLAGPEVPALVVRPDGPVGAALDPALAALRERGARPWLLAGEEAAVDPRALDASGGLPEPLSPLAYALPGYRVAEAVARARDLDPDRPPGLTKVTRTH